LRDKTFRVRDALADLHEKSWFNVGDRDLALHLLRMDHLRSGYSLTSATRELSHRLDVVDVTVLPASDEPNETRILLKYGRLLHFQEWYVGEGAKPELSEVRLADGGLRRPLFKPSRMPKSSYSVRATRSRA
jgi:LPPG:FO 2-phospho-L-lactate transferase